MLTTITDFVSAKWSKFLALLQANVSVKWYGTHDNSNNTSVNVYGAVVMTIARVHPYHSMNADSVPGGRQPLDQAIQLGLWVCLSAAIIAIYYYYSVQKLIWHSFYHLMKGWKLSQPRHYEKGAQLKAVHVNPSGCRDKRNCPWWDSILEYVTLQSASHVTMRPVSWLIGIIDYYYYILLTALFPGQLG